MKNTHLFKFGNFFIGSILGMFCTYLVTYFTNQNLTPDELGKYSYTLNLLNLLFPILSLTLYASYTRFLIDYDHKDLKKFVIKGTLLSSLIFFSYVIYFFDNYYLTLFVFAVFFQERLYWFRANEYILKYNIINILQKICLLLIVYFNLSNLNSDNVLFFTGISFFIACILGYLLDNSGSQDDLSEHSKPLDKKAILKFSVLGCLMTVITWVSSYIDQYVIQYFYGFESLAPYSVSFRIIAILTAVAVIFQSYFTVLYFKDIKSGLKRNIVTYRLAYVFVLTTTLFFMIFLSEEIYILFGAKKYIEDVVYFEWLLVGEYFRVLSAILLLYKTYKLEQFFIIKATLFVTVMNFIANLIFVPIYGPLSAAYITTSTYLVLFLISLVSLRDECLYFKGF